MWKLAVTSPGVLRELYASMHLGVPAESHAGHVIAEGTHGGRVVTLPFL